MRNGCHIKNNKPLSKQHRPLRIGAFSLPFAPILLTFPLSPRLWASLESPTMSDTAIPKIETKFPLPWVLGCTVVIALSLGGVMAKLDNLAVNVGELRAKMESRDERINANAQAIALHSNMLDRVQTDVKSLQVSVDDLRRNQRVVLK